MGVVGLNEQEREDTERVKENNRDERGMLKQPGIVPLGCLAVSWTIPDCILHELLVNVLQLPLNVYGLKM